MIDERAFARGLDLLAFRFQRRLDDDARANYSMVLDPFLSSDQFTRTCRWVCACRTIRNMPSPGDLLEMALDLPAEGSNLIPFPWARTS